MGINALGGDHPHLDPDTVHPLSVRRLDAADEQVRADDGLTTSLLPKCLFVSSYFVLLLWALLWVDHIDLTCRVSFCFGPHFIPYLMSTYLGCYLGLVPITSRRHIVMSCTVCTLD